MDNRVYCDSDCPNLNEKNTIPYCKEFDIDLERHFPKVIKCYACRNGVTNER